MYQVQDRKNSALYRLVRWIPTGWLYLPVLLVSAIFAFGGPWSVSATVAGRCAFLFAAIGIVCQIFRWKAAVGFLVALAFLYCASALLLMKVAFFLLIIGGPIALLWGGGVVVLPLLMLAGT